MEVAIFWHWVLGRCPKHSRVLENIYRPLWPVAEFGSLSSCGWWWLWLHHKIERKKPWVWWVVVGNVGFGSADFKLSCCVAHVCWWQWADSLHSEEIINFAAKTFHECFPGFEHNGEHARFHIEGQFLWKKPYNIPWTRSHCPGIIGFSLLHLLQHFAACIALGVREWAHPWPLWCVGL